MARRVCGEGLNPSGSTEMWSWTMGRLRGAPRRGQAGIVRALDTLRTLIWAFLDGLFRSRYFGFCFRHLESVSDFVYTLLSLQGSTAPSKLQPVAALTVIEDTGWLVSSVISIQNRHLWTQLEQPFSLATHRNSSQIGIDFYAE